MKTGVKKKTLNRRSHAVRPQRKTTRVTVDFPINEHRRLKALASLEGMTMQEYIRTSVMEKVDTADIPDAKFRKLMGKILSENEDALKRLADK